MLRSGWVKIELFIWENVPELFFLRCQNWIFFLIFKGANIRCFILIVVEIFHNIIRKWPRTKEICRCFIFMNPVKNPMFTHAIQTCLPLRFWRKAHDFLGYLTPLRLLSISLRFGKFAIFPKSFLFRSVLSLRFRIL